MSVVNFKYENGQKVKFNIYSTEYKGIIIEMIHRDDGNLYEVFVQSIKQGIFKRYYVKEEDIGEVIV